MNTHKLVLTALLVCSNGLAAPAPLELRWNELNAVVYGRTVELTLPGAFTVKGEVAAVREDGLVLDLVRREVIARYLAAENESQQTEELAITPAHYRFRLAATVERAGQRIMIFQLAPRKKQVGLFKGELWVDGQTGCPSTRRGSSSEARPYSSEKLSSLVTTRFAMA